MTQMTVARRLTNEQQQTIARDLNRAVQIQLDAVSAAYQLLGGIPERGLKIPGFGKFWRVDKRGKLVWTHNFRPLDVEVDRLFAREKLRLIVALSHLTSHRALQNAAPRRTSRAKQQLLSELPTLITGTLEALEGKKCEIVRVDTPKRQKRRVAPAAQDYLRVWPNSNYQFEMSWRLRETGQIDIGTLRTRGEHTWSDWVLVEDLGKLKLSQLRSLEEFLRQLPEQYA